MAIDLGQFDAVIERQEHGIDVQILGMDGKPLGLAIRVAGPDSDRAQRAREELHQETVEEQRLVPFSPAEVAARGVRFLAKLTIGWEPNVILEGKELEFSEANAIRVYDRYRFIRQQVDNAAGNRAAFLLGSSSSSATQSEPA